MGPDRPGEMNSVALCRRWVEQVVVGLGLCPFAMEPLLNERVRFARCDPSDLEGILQAFGEEIAWMESPEGPQTTLLVIPAGVEDFDSFLDLVGAAEGVLEALGQAETFQLAHFHPDYCFEGVSTDDPGNLTNRSPVPMLHLLRCADVTAVLESDLEVTQIPARNIERMRQLGPEGLRAILSGD